MKKEKNIIDYINYNHNYSFDLVPFNELDSLIMACLSYVNLDSILKKHESISIKDAGTIFFNKYTKSELKNNMSSVQTGIKIFSSIYKTKRYGSLILSKYVKVIEDKKQFQAITIKINNKISYISFEGTDDLLDGWFEDAAMSYKFPVPSQKEAIKYINHSVNPFSNKKYILGGHSKGGNLALIASMYGKTLKKSRILDVYMFDSPGIREKEARSLEFKQVKTKVKRIVTNYSLIGLLFFNVEDMFIVKSLKKGTKAHNVLNWCIEDNNLKPAKLSSFSKKFKEYLESWLNNYTDDERKEFVHDLFDIFKRANIKSLLDLKNNKIKRVLTLIKESKKMDKKSKEIVNKFLKIMIDFFKEESSSIINEKFPSLKH